MENTTNSVTFSVSKNEKVQFNFAHGINKDSIPAQLSTSNFREWVDAFIALFQSIEDAGNEKVDIITEEAQGGHKYFPLIRQRTMKGCNVHEVKQSLLLKAASL